MQKAIEIADKIYWVGVKDWNVRNFHGYTTVRGSTYNVYLIKDEKNVLIDTVKKPFTTRLLDNISTVIDPSEIDYVISNHTEPDHSGAMPSILHVAKNAKVFATAKGKEGLTKYYGDGWDYEVVSTGDTINTGSKTLQFVSTPMAHWPDSMVTYVKEDELLFSMDCFGQHYAASGLYDTDVPYDILMRESKKYYANILMHLGRIVKKTIALQRHLKTAKLVLRHMI